MADYKSEAYSRLTDIGDVLFVDSNDEWLSFQGLFFDSLSNTLLCTINLVKQRRFHLTMLVPTMKNLLSIQTSPSMQEIYDSGGCPTNPTRNTSSSLITLGGIDVIQMDLDTNVPEQYGSPRDNGFCSAGMSLSYYNANAFVIPRGMEPLCIITCHMNYIHSTIWVRPTDYDGDGLTVAEDYVSDLDELIVNDCDEDGLTVDEDCDDNNPNIGNNFLDCDEDGVPKG